MEDISFMMDSDSFPLPANVQSAILETCFGFQLRPENKQWSLNSMYFNYYQQVVESSSSSSWSITKTHRDILNILQLVAEPGPNGTREAVRATLESKLSNDEIEDADEILEGSLNLASRLLLMVSMEGFLSSRRLLNVSGETRLNWNAGTLGQLLSPWVPEIEIKEKVKLEQIFNARNIEQIGGIKIRWTNNLVDHLRMRDNDTAVEIFHCASFLRFHQHCQILPPGLVDETISTLALLLPEHDEDVKAWFQMQQVQTQKQGGHLGLDPLARECGQLKVSERKAEKFGYYHDRLVTLKQVFDEVEPSTLKQWWYDRRKRVQWYTFWVAALVLVLTIFFGLVQCVEGALQVYLAAKPGF